jgi:hypothetical protein
MKGETRMTIQKTTLAGLAVVAVVAAGVIAYQTDAFGGGKDCASKASAGQCAGKSETTSASGAKAGCCASKSASTQASTTEGATVVPVGAGASCGMKSEGASKAGASCTYKGTETAGAGSHCSGGEMACGGCNLYKTYWTSLEKAGFEMAAVPNGIVITLSSSDPAVLSELVKYSNAKVAMYKGLNADEPMKGCSFCQEKATLMKGATFAVSNDDHSVKTVITSEAPTTVAGLHKIASMQQATETEKEIKETAKVEG